MTRPIDHTTSPPIAARLGRFRAAIWRDGGVTLERTHRVPEDKRNGSDDDGYRRVTMHMFADEIPVLRELLSVAMREVIDVTRPDNDVDD